MSKGNDDDQLDLGRCCIGGSFLNLNTPTILSTSAKSAVIDLDVEHQLDLPCKVTSASHKIYRFTSNQLSFHFKPGGIAVLRFFPTPSLQLHLQTAAMSLTEWQFYAMQVTERTASALSLLGAAFIISTFSVNKNFHKPINRLVFYACFGNVMANIGTLISTSGVSSGPDGPLCQFQAFLIQMYVFEVRTASDRISDSLQVPASRCSVDPSHGLECLPRLLPQIQPARLETLGVDVRNLLLRRSSCPSSDLPIHHCTR